MADGKKKKAAEVADDLLPVDPTTSALREEVARRQGPEDGTMVRYTYCYDLTQKKKFREYYTYGAVFIGSKDLWYITGQGSSVPREMTHEQFMALLAKANVPLAEVVTAFDTFKP